MGAPGFVLVWRRNSGRSARHCGRQGGNGFDSVAQMKFGLILSVTKG